MTFLKAILPTALPVYYKCSLQRHLNEFFPIVYKNREDMHFSAIEIKAINHPQPENRRWMITLSYLQ
jgi:hypothetical protein